MEIEYNLLIPSVVIYGIVMYCFWFLPEQMGMIGYKLSIKILAAVIFLPITYFIVKFVAER